MKTNAGLVEYAKAQLGRPYWYGTCGDIASVKLWEGRAKAYPRYYSKARFDKMKERGDIGKKVHDCSGLIKGYLMSNSPDMAATYKKSYDLSANGFLKNAVESGPISSIPEIPGLAVWRNNHIGIYVGGGEVIEAKGFDYGVVKSALKGSTFAKWIKLPFITYGTQIEAPAASDDAIDADIYIVVKGDTLSAIARKFNTTVSALVEQNGIKNPNLIKVGQKITLPGGEPTKEETKTWKGKVTTKNLPLNVRKTSSPNSAIIGTLPKGSVHEFQGRTVNGMIKLANRDGWCSASYINKL